MLATLIPLFNAQMDVRAYYCSAQRENYLLDSLHGGASRFDNATNTEGFELLGKLGIDTLADDRDVFIPVNHVALFSDLVQQCPCPPDRIVLVLDSGIEPEKRYYDRIVELQEEGFSFAMQNMPLGRLGDYRHIILLCDYIFLDHTRISIHKAKTHFDRFFPRLSLCAVKVDTQEQYEEMTAHGKFDLYQGNFFRLPPHSKDTQMAPMKVTYLELLNTVNEPDFELIAAADVISRDAALVVELLSVVNRMTYNYGITSVRHAAAMIGQTELKRWINTVVAKGLCSDKPSEIMRLSMIRARFAENLAKPFGMASQADELFLLGLFSVLDIMLDLPIEEALERVNVSKKITDALAYRSGEMAPVYGFLQSYERADWQEVSRQLIVFQMDMDDVYQAYLDALQWYRDLVSIGQ